MVIGVLVFEGAPLQRREQPVDIGDNEIGGAHQLHVEAGIQHVGRRHALVHEARFGTDEFGEMRQEGDNVVLGDGLDFIDTIHIKLGLRPLVPDYPRRFLGDHADLGHGGGGVRLDFEPDAKARLRLPDASHFSARVTIGIMFGSGS